MFLYINIFTVKHFPVIILVEVSSNPKVVNGLVVRKQKEGAETKEINRGEGERKFKFKMLRI